MAVLATARSINVRRTELLEKLKINRTKHAEEYKVAMEGYRIEVHKIMLDALAKFDANNNVFDDGFMLMTDIPQDHTGDYDEVIGMMEMSIDEYINLDQSSFKQFVLDQWHWKQAFAETSTKYMSNVASVRR